jgi:hypothetical protein
VWSNFACKNTENIYVKSVWLFKLKDLKTEIKMFFGLCVSRAANMLPTCMSSDAFDDRTDGTWPDG